MTADNHQDEPQQVPGLEIQRGRTAQSFRPVDGTRLVLGSAPECDVRLGGAGIPAIHSQIHLEDGQVWIESLAADPALCVNRSECDTRSLQDGDEVRIGPFIFTWRAGFEWAESVGPVVGDAILPELTAPELVDRLERDMTMVAEIHEATRLAAKSVIEAAVASVEAISPEQRNDLAARVDALTERLAEQEAAHVDTIESLLETQEQLAEQVESLLDRVLGAEAGDVDTDDHRAIA
tara:strand:- start:4288 stop:4995 length:708 start_codon:yes stop_codon:yes gene_type:complete